jgi:predicted metal-dependent peptidase
MSEKQQFDKLMEEIEWDIKANDNALAAEKLIQAKNIAKNMRNEELLNKVLELIAKNGGAGIK